MRCWPAHPRWWSATVTPMRRHCDDCRFRITSYRWRYDVREQIRSARSARRISNRAVKFGSISTGRTARSQVMNWKAPSLPCNVISMSVSTPLSNAHETDGVRDVRAGYEPYTAPLAITLEGEGP